MGVPDVERLRRFWDRHADSYDRQMAFLDRKLFGDSRRWACRGAAGDVLEVGIGTGLSLDGYPTDVALTGVDLSPRMLEHARRRAAATGRPVTLQVGDAQRLNFPDAAFDTVVCTFVLCSVPDERRAIAEMWRVLRPGGRLRLADHVVSTSAPARALQRLIELVSVPVGGEHFRRRPVTHLPGQGFAVEQQERFALGIVERVVARKPATGTRVRA